MLAVIIVTLALYGALMLLIQVLGQRQIVEQVERYGGVVDTSADRSLGYLPPELREVDRRVRAARATA
jgi:hypothetical protein